MQARALIVVGALVAALGLPACDLGDRLPPSPSETTARDAAAVEARLRAELRGLPGLRDARVVVALPVDDPLAPRPTAPPRATLALVVDGDRPGLAQAAEGAARTLLGPAAQVDVAVIAAPPRSASRRRAAAALGALAVAAAAAALALVLHRRRRVGYRGTRPQ